MLQMEQVAQQVPSTRPPPPGAEKYRWKPGQSGNPAGRRKRPVHARKLIEAHAGEWADALLEFAKSEKADSASRLGAFKLAFEYLSGPPALQPVEVLDGDEPELSAEQAAQLLEQGVS